MHWIIIGTLALALTITTQAVPPTQSETPKAAKRRPATRTKRPTVDPRAQATKVAEQIKLLTRFIYLYGKIATGLEAADEEAKRGEVNQELRAKMQQNKTSLVENIRGLQAGLANLEKSLPPSPRQSPAGLNLIRASDALARAEQLAAAGRLDEAGRTLVGAAERLVDFLVETQ